MITIPTNEIRLCNDRMLSSTNINIRKSVNLIDTILLLGAAEDDDDDDDDTVLFRPRARRRSRRW